MAETTKEKPYEAMFLFPAGVAADLDHALMTSRQMIERHDGKVLVLKKWDERKLAYEINRQKRGVYIIAYFTGPGSIVTAIERDVNLSEEILRVMITRADHLNQSEMESVEPQPVQQRAERSDDRGGWDRGPREDRHSREERHPRHREEREEAEEVASENE